jgi:SOS-response transcriptional repressor LexA
MTTVVLSDKQQRIFRYVKDFIRRHGYPPAIREIQEDLHISSTSVVKYNLRGLADKGLITMDAKKSRSIALVQIETPAQEPQDANQHQVVTPDGRALRLRDDDELPEHKRQTLGRMVDLAYRHVVGEVQRG